MQGDASKTSRLFEIARVLVRFDHVANVIVNANHKIPLFYFVESPLSVF
jgi:hypothetical protein